ncbi:MAG: flagellar basal body rod protein FlgC [Pseudomonadota bacterium]
MPLENAMSVSASGLKAQAMRMQVIAENLANKDAVADTAGGLPYRRRMVTFGAELDRATGMTGVGVTGVRADLTPFGTRYEPGHPAANAEGYVTTSNVNALVEMTDMTEAQRSYQANLSAIEAAKALAMRTIDLLR